MRAHISKRVINGDHQPCTAELAGMIIACEKRASWFFFNNAYLVSSSRRLLDQTKTDRTMINAFIVNVFIKGCGLCRHVEGYGTFS